ncbi:MAG: A24 family peptidase [Chloroflexi bacterium]|nr:A24 family peptidase [Chloroflexota bacterium]
MAPLFAVVGLYALAGLALGPLLALLIARIPTETALFERPAACPRCGADRPAWTLPPLVGTLAAPPCPSCGAALDRRRLAVELLTSVTFALIAWRFFPDMRAFVFPVYAVIFIVIGAIDLEHRLIFDIVMYPALAFGLVGGWLTGLSWLSMLLGALLWGGFIGGSRWLSLRLTGKDAVGMGDVYLAVFLGTICGFRGVFAGMFAYAIFSGLGAVILLALRQRGLKDHIPYAPFLLLGAVVGLLAAAPAD